jgi:hypothetical protein
MIFTHLKPIQYQNMIDMGWRRSGTYLYLPDTTNSCCPSHTIRLLVTSFTKDRQQRKLERRVDQVLCAQGPEECKVSHKDEKERGRIEEENERSNEKTDDDVTSDDVTSDDVTSDNVAHNAKMNDIISTLSSLLLSAVLELPQAATLDRDQVRTNSFRFRGGVRHRTNRHVISSTNAALLFLRWPTCATSGCTETAKTATRPRKRR